MKDLILHIFGYQNLSDLKASTLEEALSVILQKDFDGNLQKFSKMMIHELCKTIEMGESPNFGTLYKGFSIKPGIFEVMVEM